MEVQGRNEYTSRIKFQLGSLAAAVKLNSGDNRNDLAVDSEDTICGLLNLVFGLELVNANREKHNYPAVDLVNTKNRTAVQVTIQNTIKKVDEMLDTFQKHNLSQDFDKLILFVITENEPTKAMKMRETAGFCGDTNIWNLGTVSAVLPNLSVEKLRKVAEYLDQELGGAYVKADESAKENHVLTTYDRELRNTLMKNHFEDSEKERQKRAFNTQAKRCEVKTITFLNSLALVPADAADASLLQTNTVRAWAVKDGDLYDLYIAADGQVYAPKDSDSLFREMINLTEIHFNNAFSTKHAENMHSLFNCCVKLENLDVSGFDTSRVTNMSGMFCRCKSLKELDISSFDTSRLKEVFSMFFDCFRLRKLNLGKMDTSRVTSMFGMFSNCYELKELDVSSFNTARVENVHKMFKECISLKSPDISNWDLSSVTIWDEFLPEGKTVSMAWEKLFPEKKLET